MNQAQQRLNELEQKSILTHQEAHEAYSLCLELVCTREKVTFYKQKYTELVHAFFLNLSLNITHPNILPVFMTQIETWERDIDDLVKDLLFVLILQQKDSIKDFDSFVKLLKPERINIDELGKNHIITKIEQRIKDEQHSWLDKTQSEIIANINLRIKNKQKRELLFELVYEASITKDLEFARDVLVNLPSNRDDLKRSIEANLVKLIVHSEPDKAINLAYTLVNEAMYDPLYKVAKLLFNQDPQKAKKLALDLPIALKYAFEAFVAASHKDEQAIEALLKELNKKHETKELLTDDYEQALLASALAIANQYPLRAYAVLDMVQTHLGQRLDVELKVAIALFPLDFERSVRHIQTIDVEEFRMMALTSIIPHCEDPIQLEQLVTITNGFHSAENRYEVMIVAKDRYEIFF